MWPKAVLGAMMFLLILQSNTSQGQGDGTTSSSSSSSSSMSSTTVTVTVTSTVTPNEISPTSVMAMVVSSSVPFGKDEVGLTACYLIIRQTQRDSDFPEPPREEKTGSNYVV